MRFQFNDGGRSKYFKGQTSDCVCRSIAIATGKDYLEVYNTINKLAQDEKITKRKKTISHARTGVHKKTWKDYLKFLGWQYVSCMGIGTGCKVHLKESELPKGILLVQVSKHLTCVINGVIHDNHDCSRGEKRCVYGYFIKNVFGEKLK